MLASTLARHEQVAEIFGDELGQRVVVTDELSRVADEIRSKATTDEDKVSRAYDWVRKNIRYVAVYLSVGGWVPHDVAWILEHRYGDCKDRVLLLISLLKALGVEAAPVLININDQYAATELPVNSSYNHCIVYVPSLKRFLDPSDSRTSADALSWADSDKPVAVALSSGPALMRTPAFTPESNTIGFAPVSPDTASHLS